MEMLESVSSDGDKSDPPASNKRSKEKDGALPKAKRAKHDDEIISLETERLAVERARLQVEENCLAQLVRLNDKLDRLF